MNLREPKYRIWFCAAIAIVVVIVGGVYVWSQQNVKSPVVIYQTSAESDSYVRFTMEAYDKVQKEFWMPHDQYDINEYFRLSLQKASNTNVILASSTRAGVADMLGKTFASATSTYAKKQLATTVVGVLLYNLQPIGRSNLLSSQQVTQLRQDESNINPGKDLYKDLGTTKGATQQEVEKQYQQKVAEIKQSTSTAAPAQLEKVSYAHKVLSDDNTKTRYDQRQIEPTVFTRVFGKTLYLYLEKVSPTSLQEFALAIDHASSTPGLDSMVLDLRGNIGGTLEFFQHFFGIFIGQNQYAFDLFHQGDYLTQRTLEPKFGELSRFHDIAILTDGMTQSTAELTTATFKHFNLAHVVGATTRGWGSVENTFPMTTSIDASSTYALLLVHSLTLRDDGQPIESRGVDPDVRIADPSWRSELPKYFRSPSLIQAVSKTVVQSPLK